MLQFPGNLNPELFLQHHWQQRPLHLPAAYPVLRPSISRNELAWLATLDDVESRLVFVQRDKAEKTYHVETGPFDTEYLQALPKRDWTLLVHDVEKHLPQMRALFAMVPFVPDWRIDDLMVSFAAPGGGVGPHKDNYDVFLCQGIGVRHWRYSELPIDEDLDASENLALLCEFKSAHEFDCREGDVIYLPPGVAHWGTAIRACMTYSIGMRAPLKSDLSVSLGLESPGNDEFYSDKDLQLRESVPGFLSESAAGRAAALMRLDRGSNAQIAKALGEVVTQTKDWLRPDTVRTDAATDRVSFTLHGMARVAFDQQHVYVNGFSRERPQSSSQWLAKLCADRHMPITESKCSDSRDLLRWMMQHGAFDLPENS